MCIDRLGLGQPNAILKKSLFIKIYKIQLLQIAIDFPAKDFGNIKYGLSGPTLF